VALRRSELSSTRLRNLRPPKPAKKLSVVMTVSEARGAEKWMTVSRFTETPALAAPAAPPNATAAQRFSTSEVREVLGKAIEGQAAKQGTKLGFEDLLAVAAEVGVDPESLREASRALRARNAPENKAPLAPVAKDEAPPSDLAQKSEAWIRRRKRMFRRHAGVYVIVNAALLILGLVLLPVTPWWVWFIAPLLWGIGLAIHGLVAATSHQDDFHEENRRMQWWLEERRRRHEERLAWSSRGGRDFGRREADEPKALNEPRGPRGQRGTRGAPGRIAESGDTAKDKLRVADTGAATGTDQMAAEEEAGASAQEEAGRKKRR